MRRTTLSSGLDISFKVRHMPRPEEEAHTHTTHTVALSFSEQTHTMQRLSWLSFRHQARSQLQAVAIIVCTMVNPAQNRTMILLLACLQSFKKVHMTELLLHMPHKGLPHTAASRHKLLSSRQPATGHTGSPACLSFQAKVQLYSTGCPQPQAAAAGLKLRQVHGFHAWVGAMVITEQAFQTRQACLFVAVCLF